MSLPSFAVAAPLVHARAPPRRPRLTCCLGSPEPPLVPSPPPLSPPPPPPQSPPPPRRLVRQVVGAALAAAATFVIHTTNAPPRAVPNPATLVEAVTAPAARLRPPLRTPIPIALRPRKVPPPVLTPAAEATMMLRMGVAVACGAIIGTERRAAAANAGIRTLSLVSLGSAIFSLTSLHGLGGDPARMGAAISTGIGFLGSGAINGDIYGSRRQLVTAASIWIAAALGVAAASGLYSMALMGAIATVWILRWQLMHRYARMFLGKKLEQVRVMLGMPPRQRKSRTVVVVDEAASLQSDYEYESWKR